MPEHEAQAGEFPDATEVRASLAQMAVSEAFRGSPQLVSFLRYVVEETLRGAADRIKGYTIAVEALGRDENFDPQADPIVRVEAMRLRRALSRYYGNGGKHDPVAIELPLGSYVPVFRRAPPQVEEVRAAPAAAPALPVLPAEAPAPRATSWRRYAAAAALVLAGAALYAGAEYALRYTAVDPVTVSGIAPVARLKSPETPREPPPLPLVYVAPIVFSGPGEAGRAGTRTMREELRDALARFDEVDVTVDAPPQAHYALTGRTEYDARGRVSLAFQLTDTENGLIAYANSFSRSGRDGDVAQSDDTIVRQVATAIAQPYGIIQARERLKSAAGGTYRCLLAVFDYQRSLDPGQYARARDCLDRATAAAPDFALGFAALATIALDEYRDGALARPSEPPPLQRALAAARQAVKLLPESARTLQALSDVQFARGDYPLAIEAGERALILNPYDPDILARHGAQLIAVGERDRGARLLREAASAIVVRPPWHDFYLFLAAYLADDQPGAARYAALIAPETYAPGLLARALVASHRGDTSRARELRDRLITLQPGWREDCRAELRKYFASESIIERISRDLRNIGYAGQ